MKDLAKHRYVSNESKKTDYTKANKAFGDLENIARRTGRKYLETLKYDYGSENDRKSQAEYTKLLNKEVNYLLGRYGNRSIKMPVSNAQGVIQRVEKVKASDFARMQIEDMHSKTDEYWKHIDFDW